VVEGNFKWISRIKCLEAIAKTLSCELKYRHPTPYRDDPATEPMGQAFFSGAVTY
jgi:hypothetical protein